MRLFLGDDVHQVNTSDSPRQKDTIVSLPRRRYAEHLGLAVISNGMFFHRFSVGRAAAKLASADRVRPQEHGGRKGSVEFHANGRTTSAGRGANMAIVVAASVKGIALPCRSWSPCLAKTKLGPNPDRTKSRRGRPRSEKGSHAYYRVA